MKQTPTTNYTAAITSYFLWFLLSFKGNLKMIGPNRSLSCNVQDLIKNSLSPRLCLTQLKSIQKCSIIESSDFYM